MARPRVNITAMRKLSATVPGGVVQQVDRYKMAAPSAGGGDLAKAKLEELFTAWLSLEETANRVDHWLELGGRGELEASGEASSLSAPAASHPRRPPVFYPRGR